MYTAQDVAFHLIASAGGGAQDGEHHAVRLAVIRGTQEVLQCRAWKWHERTGSFVTKKAASVVGTASANSNVVIWEATQYPGGSAKMFQDLAGASWPLPVGTQLLCSNASAFSGLPKVTEQNVIMWNAQIGGSRLDRTARASGQVTFKTAQYYDLPVGVKDIDALVTETAGTLHCYLTPQEWQRLEVNTKGSGEPYYYTIMRSEENPEQWQIRFVGEPSAGLTVYYTYRYIPKEIRYIGYEMVARDGRVTATSGGSNTLDLTTVTKVSGDYTVDGKAAFPTDLNGTVIRFGTASEDANPVGDNIPYMRERVIAGRGGNGTLYLSESIAPRSNVRYCLTDPIDASPTMFRAILSAAEMWYARMVGKPAEAVMAMYNRDLRIAMENDQIAPMSGRPSHSPYPTPRTMGWHSNLLPDVS